MWLHRGELQLDLSSVLHALSFSVQQGIHHQVVLAKVWSCPSLTHHRLSSRLLQGRLTSCHNPVEYPPGRGVPPVTGTLSSPHEIGREISIPSGPLIQ